MLLSTLGGRLHSAASVKAEPSAPAERVQRTQRTARSLVRGVVY